MNIYNPAVNNNVVFPDAISRRPIKDALGAINLNSGGTFIIALASLPRDYRTCRMVAFYHDNGVANIYQPLMGAPLFFSGTTWAYISVRIAANGDITIVAEAPPSVLAPGTTNVLGNLFVECWAP